MRIINQITEFEVKTEQFKSKGGDLNGRKMFEAKNVVTWTNEAASRHAEP